MMNHTENPDFNRLLWGIPLFIAACLVIAWASSAQAAVPKYWVCTVGSLGTDSSDAAPDSVVLYWIDQASAVWDSAAMSPANTDSLAWYYQLGPGIEGWLYGYNPTAYAQWFFLSGSGAILRDNALGIFPYSISAVDTLIKGVAATASVDWVVGSDTIDQVLTAAHGAGAWTSGTGGTGGFPETLFVYDSTNGALVQGATIHIKAADTGSYQNSSGPQATNSSGYAIFSIDAGTFPVAADAQTYFQAGAYQLVTQASPGGRDTVFLYAFAATPPSGGDSCTVVAFTNNSGSTAEITLAMGGMLQDTSGVFLTPKVDVAQANGLGVISFTLPRTAATRQNTIWKVTIKDQDGTTIGEVPKYEVPSQAIDTIWVVTKAKP